MNKERLLQLAQRLETGIKGHAHDRIIVLATWEEVFGKEEEEDDE